MKKTLCVMLAAVLICISLCSCSRTNADMTESNITASVEVLEKALKEFDTKKLNKYVDSATLNIIISYAEKHKQFSELGKAIFENLELEVSSIDVEEGTVLLTVKNKDLYGAASDFATELKSNYSTFQLLKLLNDEDFLDQKLLSLCENIDEAQMIQSPIDMKLRIRPGKKNLVFVFDENAEDSVSGGALSAIKNIY